MALINKEKLNQLKHKAKGFFFELKNRSLDQKITLAVTGLSRSGKTAFITSLVNQLINEGNGSPLSFFDPIHQGRFIAAKRVAQKHFHIPRFDYDGAIQALSASPPSWPKPTEGISELRLAIRYQPKSSLLKYATDSATLYLDITDYPGEWLLDLPMLNQTYEQWSKQTIQLLSQAPRQAIAKDFIEKINAIDPLQTADESLLAQLSAQYTELLVHFRHQLGLSVIQPGRFILPGELAGAPILQFIPFPHFGDNERKPLLNAVDESVIGTLRSRFYEYKERVVRKFYKAHFVHFDRQIILADCLTPLNNGADSFADLQQAISMIMESFNYGQSSLFSRLFSPKIDKLLFAATKADHVTPDQHSHLVSLLNQLVHQTKHQLNFDIIKMKTLAVAAVNTTNVGTSQHQGKSLTVIQGRRTMDDNLITVFPGTVPKQLPDNDFWQKKSFDFISFSPKTPLAAHQRLPHLRLDQVLQFLLADKMK